MDEAREHLQALGFSEYEAKAYIALAQRGPMTGYQLARASAIPRPNIYPVLDKLQQRGAVSRIEVTGGVRYRALPSDEMLVRLGREVSSRLDKARRAMTALERATPGEQVWNLQGYEALMARGVALIDSARRQLLAGVWAAESAQLSEAVGRAEARGVVVTTLCIQGCTHECGGCRGDIYRYPVAGETKKRWLVLSADDQELMIGHVLRDGSAEGAVTRLEVLVSVGSHYLRNAIAAAEIVRSLGPRLRPILDERARRALEGAGLSTAGESWLERAFASVGQVEE